MIKSLIAVLSKRIPTDSTFCLSGCQGTMFDTFNYNRTSRSRLTQTCHLFNDYILLIQNAFIAFIKHYMTTRLPTIVALILFWYIYMKFYNVTYLPQYFLFEINFGYTWVIPKLFRINNFWFLGKNRCVVKNNTFCCK